VSLTFRNGHALAMRPGLRGDWAGALAAFDATTYVNELGLPARAHRTPDIAAVLAGAGLRPVAWFGVRVLTDAAAASALRPIRTRSPCCSTPRSGRGDGALQVDGVTGPCTRRARSVTPGWSHRSSRRSRPLRRGRGTHTGQPATTPATLHVVPPHGTIDGGGETGDPMASVTVFVDEAVLGNLPQSASSTGW